MHDGVESVVGNMASDQSPQQLADTLRLNIVNRHGVEKSVQTGLLMGLTFLCGDSHCIAPFARIEEGQAWET